MFIEKELVEDENLITEGRTFYTYDIYFKDEEEAKRVQKEFEENFDFSINLHNEAGYTPYLSFIFGEYITLEETPIEVIRYTQGIDSLLEKLA